MSAVLQHTSAFDAYIRHGWQLCGIEPGSKGPKNYGWNEPENALRLGTQLPDGYGTGLMHSLSGTCAFDIDNWNAAEIWFKEKGIDLKPFFNAPDAVGIDSGNPGHAKLIFALPFPLPTKKLVVGNATIFEFRCATAGGKTMQDVLPPSRHPSGTTYRWVGAGRWENLPTIPQALLDVWQVLLEPDNSRTIPTGAFSPASIIELSSALNSIDPSCDRKTWIECLMGMKKSEHADAYDICRQWSMLSSKYPGDREFDKQWASMKNTMPKGVTPGTVFYYAQQSGWVRPAPDVSELFKPVEAKTMQAVKYEVTPGAELPVCDLQLWPERLRNRADEVATQVGCDPVVALLAGLCAVSGAVDKRCRLQISQTWAVPPTFWSMTIGEPADKKSPGSKPMFEPLRKLEIEHRLVHSVEMMDWEAKAAAYASAMKAYREAAGDSGATENTQLPTVPTLPPEPQPKRLLLNDATTQKIVTMAAGRPEGFLLWLDEMNNWFGRVGNKGHTDDRGCWIQGYETGYYAFDRMGAGSIHVDNFALSIYGNCQPTVFRQHAAETASDGLLQRFMPVVLDPSKNTMWQDGVPEFMSFSSDYEQLIRRTHGLPAFSYVMESAANQLFRAFSEWALGLRADERMIQVSTSYNTALGKLEGNCARLLLLFHLIEAPHEPFISEETTRKAILLMQQFFYPMLRYTFLTVGQERDALGDAILDYLVQAATVKPTVTMPEIRRAIPLAISRDRNPRQLDDGILIVMEDVIDRGWAAYHTHHTRSPTFAINPALADHYKEQRRAIIMAKQRNVERLRKNIAEQYGRDAVKQSAMGYNELKHDCG